MAVNTVTVSVNTRWHGDRIMRRDLAIAHRVRSRQASKKNLDGKKEKELNVSIKDQRHAGTSKSPGTPFSWGSHTRSLFTSMGS